MEIKLVRMRDLGTAEAQGLPLSHPICNSFFFFFFLFFNRELTSVSDRKKMPPVLAVKNVI